MLIHAIIQKAEVESEESAGYLACKERALAVVPLPPPPTAPRILPSPPARSAGSGRTLTLAAAGHVQERPERLSKWSAVLRVSASRGDSKPLGACPRHTFSIPSLAGAPSSRSRGQACSAALSLRRQFGKTSSAGYNLGFRMHLSVCRSLQCVWRFTCMRVIVIQQSAKVWARLLVCEEPPGLRACEHSSTVDLRVCA